MTTALTAFSSSTITPKALADLMRYLNAEFVIDRERWILERNEHKVIVEMGMGEVDAPPKSMKKIVELLEAWPVSHVVIMFEDSDPTVRFEYRMARAVAIAMSERWPIALYDHSGNVDLVEPPGAHRAGED